MKKTIFLVFAIVLSSSLYAKPKLPKIPKIPGAKDEIVNNPDAERRSIIATCLVKTHSEPVKGSHISEHSQQTFRFKALHECSRGLCSGEYDGKKIKVCEYFPARFCKISFL